MKEDIMINNGFSKILVLIILIILIGGGYFGWQYFGAPKEEVKDETADWKTYRNEEYGFEFKYPENLNTEIPYNAPGLFIIYFVEERREGVETERVEIGTLGPAKPFNLTEEINFNLKRANATRTEFKNKQAVLWGSYGQSELEFPGVPFKGLLVYLDSEGRRIKIGYFGDGHNEAPYNQILSTFRFLE